jgi:IclR helix-turn-helix domain
MSECNDPPSTRARCTEAVPTHRRADGACTVTVQSLERGLAVIRAVDAQHAQPTLSDVCRATGLTCAAARRFLLRPGGAGARGGLSLARRAAADTEGSVIAAMNVSAHASRAAPRLSARSYCRRCSAPPASPKRTCAAARDTKARASDRDPLTAEAAAQRTTAPER